MNNCMHIIDVKNVGNKVVTYCTQCGTIFSIMEFKDYNCRDSYITSNVDLASSPYMVKSTKE